MAEASMATVDVPAVGADHASAEQSQVIGSIVTEIVLVDPALLLQSANFVVTVKVSVTVAVISLPYCYGSIVRVFEPEVEESVIAAQVVTTLALLSVIV